MTGVEKPRSRQRVPKFSAGRPSATQNDIADIVASIVTVLFGGIHCFAWNFPFPSSAEQLLWRIASVLITVLPVGWIMIYTYSFSEHNDLPPADWAPGYVGITVKGVLSSIVVPFYLIGRAILLGIAVSSLRSLPAASYETVRWTTFIPHTS